MVFGDYTGGILPEAVVNPAHARVIKWACGADTVYGLARWRAGAHQAEIHTGRGGKIDLRQKQVFINVAVDQLCFECVAI